MKHIIQFYVVQRRRRPPKKTSPPRPRACREKMMEQWVQGNQEEYLDVSSLGHEGLMQWGGLEDRLRVFVRAQGLLDLPFVLDGDNWSWNLKDSPTNSEYLWVDMQVDKGTGVVSLELFLFSSGLDAPLWTHRTELGWACHIRTALLTARTWQRLAKRLH